MFNLSHDKLSILLPSDNVCLELDNLVSLINDRSFACIPLVYMYPPMLHMKAVAESKWEKGLDLGLAIFGGIALFYTTYQLLG